MAQVGQIDRFASSVDAFASLGRQESVIAMEKQAKTEFADGVMQVSQGATLTKIEQEQPWYNKVFGSSATMRGAETQTAQASIAQYFTDESLFIDSEDGKALDPESYRKRQTDNMSSVLTGNSVVDSMITAQITPKLGALAESQTKAHRAYVNEQNVLSVGNNILTQANSVDTLARSKGWGHDLVSEAKAGLAETLANPPAGMEKSSYRKLLVQSVLTNYAQGSDVMDLAVREMGIQFTPGEQLQIANAKKSWMNQQQGKLSLEAADGYAEIWASVDKGIVTDAATLTQQLNAYQNTHGDLSQANARSIYKMLGDRTAEAAVLDNQSNLVFQGQIHQIPKPADRQAAIQHAKKRIDSYYPADDQGKAQARKAKLQLWNRNLAGTKDDALVAKFGHLQSGFVKGEVDQNYLNIYDDWKDYYALAPERATEMLTSENAKATAVGVASLMEAGTAATPEDALRIVQAQKETAIDKTYMASSAFREDLTTQVDNLVESRSTWFGLAAGREKTAAVPVVSNWVKRKTEDLMRLNFDMDTAIKTAANMYKENFDLVMGVPLKRKAGVPLATQMQLIPGGKTPTEAIKETLAAGFNGDRPLVNDGDRQDYRVISVFDDQLIVQINDPDNPAYPIATRTYSLKAIGLHSNTEQKLEFTEEAVMADTVRNAVYKRSYENASIRAIREAQGMTATDSSIDAEFDEVNDRIKRSAKWLWGMSEDKQDTDPTNQP